MQVFTVFTALSLPLAWASPQFQRRQVNCTVGQIVKTSSGAVAGHAATNYSEVSEYLGIPYAQAPMGDLRFAVPVKYAGSSMLNGSVFVGFQLILPLLIQLTCLRVSHALPCHPNILLPHPLKLRLQISPMSDSNFLVSSATRM